MVKEAEVAGLLDNTSSDGRTDMLAALQSTLTGAPLPLLDPWFQDAVVHNWRDGQKLIPDAWIEQAHSDDQ